MKEITIILLTCHRLDGLKRALNSFNSVTCDIPYNLLVMADNNDIEAYKYCVDNNIKCLLSNSSNDFTLQANIGTYACETPYFIIFSDDMEAVGENWLGGALGLFKEQFPDGIGLMSFNEEIQHGRIFTVGMSSKKFIEYMNGHMYYPGYRHYKGDREITELSRILNLYYYTDSVHIKHHHWQSDKTVDVDETYKTSRDKFLKQDRKLKDKRDKQIDLLITRNYYNYEDTI